MTAPHQTVRIAAVGDIHCTKTETGRLQPFFAEASQAADVLLLCGDLTDYGLAEEAQTLALEITTGASVPVIAVLGNHDYESGTPDAVADILIEAGVTLLDGDSCEVAGVGFAGVKGFGGGFGQRALQPWGEEIIKRYVRESVDEALKLESALARLRTEQRIGVLHYAPIEATVRREPPEIYAFLGSSRLEEPLTRYPVAAVFHGHAHYGCPEGQLSDGTPVFNVAMPLLQHEYRDRAAFRVFEVQVAQPVG